MGPVQYRATAYTQQNAALPPAHIPRMQATWCSPAALAGTVLACQPGLGY